MSRSEVVALVTLATASFPSILDRDPEPVVNAWRLMLPDIPYPLARAAVIKTCRNTRFFPSVAEIVAAARELDPAGGELPTAAEAWEEVSGQIRDVGPYRAPRYSCETVRRAARAIGWRQLCSGENPEADRAHFLRLYESMRQKQKDKVENEAVLALAGLDGLIARTVAACRLPGEERKEED